MNGKNVNRSLWYSYFQDIWRIKCFFLLIFLICLVSCSHPVCDPLEDDEPKRRFTIIIQPGTEGKDAEISSYDPGKNFGNFTSLNAVTWAENIGPFIERGFFDFDIKKYIPSDAKIISAHLKLFPDTSKIPNIIGNSGNSYKGVKFKNEWQICRIEQSWDENKITWFNQPKVSSSDVLNLPGSQFSAEALPIDVTEHIRQKYKGNPDYHGFMIRNKDESPNQCIVFCSSDIEHKELRPQLIVEYEK